MAHRMKARGPAPTYSWMDVLMASASQPMPQAKRRFQTTRMWQALASLETAAQPSTEDWRICSDAVNLLETLVTTNNGWWPDCDGEPVQVQDASGLLNDAVTALALAGRRHTAGQTLRLDGPGIQTVRAVLEDYQTVLDTLPHRTMVQCHIATERRVRAILRGHRRPHDVEIIDL